jgi:carbonic anhydrase
MTYDNEALYLKGWHIHSPTGHTVQIDRSKAELHLVHANATGTEGGVVAIRINLGNSESALFSQFLTSANTLPSFDSQDGGGDADPYATGV